MPEREGVKTLTAAQRRKQFARARVAVAERVEDDIEPMNRAQRRAMERALVRELRHGGALDD